MSPKNRSDSAPNPEGCLSRERARNAQSVSNAAGGRGCPQPQQPRHFRQRFKRSIMASYSNLLRLGTAAVRHRTSRVIAPLCFIALMALAISAIGGCSGNPYAVTKLPEGPYGYPKPAAQSSSLDGDLRLLAA